MEEQFYLCWPLLVLLLPLKRTKQLSLSLAVAAPIFRLATQAAFPELHRVNYFPLACTDALCLGAYLACVSQESQERHAAARAAAWMGTTGLLAGVAALGLTAVYRDAFVLQTIGHTCLVLIYVWIVFRAAEGFGGPAGWLLNWRALQFLGMISYGLYVFHHFFTPESSLRVLGLLGLPDSGLKSLFLILICQLTLTLGVATLSWYLYEKPLNGLKRYFRVPRYSTGPTEFPGTPQASTAACKAAPAPVSELPGV